jgi:DNA-binding XRE family transcriptional regulator
LINGRQIAAARHLLSLSQRQLAHATGLHMNVISKFENGTVQNPSSDTLKKLILHLTGQGILFTETGGVDLMHVPIVHFKGIRWYEELLDDVLRNLEGAEDKTLYIENADDSVSPDFVKDKIAQLVHAGITMRTTIKEGHKPQGGALDHYRCLPAHKFLNYIRLTYADKVAVQVGTNHCMVIKHSVLSATLRNNIEILWDYLPAPQQELKRHVDI